MHKMDKTSAVSLTVMFTGCLLSFAGPSLEPTQTTFAAGLTLTNLGFLQFYYGSVLEIERQKRFRYFVFGVPVTIALAYVSFGILKDYLPSWYMILAVVIATLGLQCAITLVGVKLCNYHH